MKTTLNKIRQHSPCTSGWAKLLKHLGKTVADDVELDLLTVLESNGLDDTLWCLQAVDGFDREKRLLAVAFAREVQHLMTDPRSLAAIDVDAFAASVAARAAYAADAYTAAYAAARAAAYHAAYDAARGAYHDADARAAARAATQQKQIEILKKFLTA